MRSLTVSSTVRIASNWRLEAKESMRKREAAKEATKVKARVED